MKNHSLIDLMQIEPSKPGYNNLYEQLEFGRFNSVESGAAPVLFQEITSTAGQRLFRIPHGTFTVGDHSLQIFVNGQLLRVGADNDYIEIDSQSIEFTFDLPEGEIVVFRVAGGTSGPSLHENHVATAGQIKFKLGTSYTVGNHSLIVYVGGVYQTVDVDYLETGVREVTFTEPLEFNDLVTFRVEGTPLMNSKYENNIVVTRFDNDGNISSEDVLGDTRISKEFEYDVNGLPSRMIIREGGLIITKEYVWVDGVNTEIRTSIREGT